MNAKGRREPDNGYGLRMDSWSGVAVDRMRVGGPGRWESVAISRFREYLDREDGLSVRGRWRLTNDPRRNQSIRGTLPRAGEIQNARHDVRRNVNRERNNHVAPGCGDTHERGRGSGVVAASGRGRDDARPHGRERGDAGPRGRGRGDAGPRGRGRGDAGPRGLGRSDSYGLGRGSNVDAERNHGGIDAAGSGRGRGFHAIKPAWMTSSSGSGGTGNAPGASLPQRRSAPETEIAPPPKRTRMNELLSVARAAGVPAAEDTPEGRARLALLVATGAAALMARTGNRVEVSADLRRLLSLSPTAEVRALVPDDGSPFLVQSTPASSARLRALAFVARRLRAIRAARATDPSTAMESEVVPLVSDPSAVVSPQPVSGANVQHGDTQECEISPQEPSD